MKRQIQCTSTSQSCLFMSFPAVSSVALLSLTNSGLSHVHEISVHGQEKSGEIRRNQESISRRKRRLVYHCVSTLGANKSPLFPATCRHGRHGSRTVISNPQDPKHACGRPPLGVSLLSFSPNWGAPENGGIPYTP